MTLLAFLLCGLTAQSLEYPRLNTKAWDKNLSFKQRHFQIADHLHVAQHHEAHEVVVPTEKQG
jgi:hypothetical protein